MNTEKLKQKVNLVTYNSHFIQKMKANKILQWVQLRTSENFSKYITTVPLKVG